MIGFPSTAALKRAVNAKSASRTISLKLSSSSPCRRTISGTPIRWYPEEEGRHKANEGRFARTDENVRIEYPDETGIPPTKIVRGAGGVHYKRTLPEFSLENKVTIVTGGARGLGLVMAQSIVTSGSDVAIVDLNST